MKEAKDGMKQEALAMMGDPTAEKPQTQLMDMFYMMYEAEAGADVRVEGAGQIRQPELSGKVVCCTKDNGILMCEYCTTWPHMV